MNDAGTLIESWNGVDWSVDVSPNSETATNDLLGVSCSSKKSCEAGGGGPATLIEVWNGKTWKIAVSPTSVSTSLASMSCASAAFCAGAGASVAGGVAQPFTEVWNGTVWKPAFLSAPGTGADDGVSCIATGSTTLCKAVGTYQAGGVWNTLIESYHG
jgi:hypothetical protein